MVVLLIDDDDDDDDDVDDVIGATTTTINAVCKSILLVLSNVNVYNKYLAHT